MRASHRTLRRPFTCTTLKIYFLFSHLLIKISILKKPKILNDDFSEKPFREGRKMPENKERMKKQKRSLKMQIKKKCQALHPRCREAKRLAPATLRFVATALGQQAAFRLPKCHHYYILARCYLLLMTGSGTSHTRRALSKIGAKGDDEMNKRRVWKGSLKIFSKKDEVRKFLIREREKCYVKEVAVYG